MRPLTACRVLDLGIITAGAATSAVLADLGAQVFKIESESYRDPFRKWEGELLDGEHPDLPPFFRMTNRGKANLGLDLKRQQGRDVFLRLVENCDVVVENFSRGVLGRLGLGYDALKAANPDIVLASISSQGEDGCDAGYVSFGSTLEAMAGLAAVTGYEDGPPVISGIELNYPDQVVAIFAAGMIATAWHAKERGGGGAHLDLSQRELTSFLSGDAFLAPARRQGNAQRGFPVQDCFRSRDGQWLAVSVDEAGLDWLRREAGGDTSERLSSWVAERTGVEALETLALAGIAAAVAGDGRHVLADRGTGWSRALLEAEDGSDVKGVLFDDGTRPASVDRPAAHLGADSREILRGIGGFTADEIRRLIADGIVSVRDEQVAREAPMSRFA